MVAAVSAGLDLVRGDCLEGMARMTPGAVDAVVTSPPYNLGVRYSTYRDDQPLEEYLQWIEKVGESVRRVLSEEGSFFINAGSTPQNPWRAWDVARRIGRNFRLQNQILWVKSIVLPKGTVRSYPGILEDVAAGHYKPVNSQFYLNQNFEFIFHFTKSGRVPIDRLAVGTAYQDKSNIGRWRRAAADKRCRGNTWFIPYRTITSRQKDRPHPATFPVELAEMCLRLHGLAKIRRVLDPFVGIGSTALACRKLGVNFTGFDIDAAYLAEARRRLEAV